MRAQRKCSNHGVDIKRLLFIVRVDLLFELVLGATHQAYRFSVRQLPENTINFSGSNCNNVNSFLSCGAMEETAIFMQILAA